MAVEMNLFYFTLVTLGMLSYALDQGHFIHLLHREVVFSQMWVYPMNVTTDPM